MLSSSASSLITQRANTGTEASACDVYRHPQPPECYHHGFRAVQANHDSGLGIDTDPDTLVHMGREDPQRMVFPDSRRHCSCLRNVPVEAACSIICPQ